MDFSKLTAYIDRLPEVGFPLCDVVVTHHGKTVYRHSTGFSDHAKTRPVSERDIYYIFSISKITTCVSALRLIEAGKIALTDPVSKYLPAFADVKVKQPDGSLLPAKNVMTIEHLFTMTAGLNYKVDAPEIQRVAADPTADTVAIANAIATMPLDFEPGTAFAYSLCHDVLGAVVEVVSGERFGDFVKKNVFDPLGMKDTGYHLPEEKSDRLACMYQHVTGPMKATPIPTSNQKFVFTPAFDGGGAGLYSTVNDQIRLMTVLANGGTTEDGYVLLSRDTIREMGVNRLSEDVLATFEPTKHYGYGFGLCCRAHFDQFISDSPAAIGEFGWDGAGGAYALVDPTNEVAIYLGTHMIRAHYIYRMVHIKVRRMIYEALGLA